MILRYTDLLTNQNAFNVECFQLYRTSAKVDFELCEINLNFLQADLLVVKFKDTPGEFYLNKRDVFETQTQTHLSKSATVTNFARNEILVGR